MLSLSVRKFVCILRESITSIHMQALSLHSLCLRQYFIQNHFWMRLCVSTETTIQNSSRTIQSSHLITPFLPFCTALNTTCFDSKLVLPINLACQISKQNNYETFLDSPVLFCWAYSHKANTCFFAMIYSCVVVISPYFYLYELSGRKWLMVMEVSVNGFNLQGMDYFFLVEEVGELDSLIFQSRNWANFYRLIINILCRLGKELEVEGREG